MYVCMYIYIYTYIHTYIYIVQFSSSRTLPQIALSHSRNVSIFFFWLAMAYVRLCTLNSGGFLKWRPLVLAT
jgi:hypothetical protein